MTWYQRIHFKVFLQGTLWFIPLLFGLLGTFLGTLSCHLDQAFGWKVLDFHPHGAMLLISSVAGAMFAFIGIVVSMILIVIQFASGQLSPRLNKTILNDVRVKLIIGFFCFFLIYTLVVMLRTRDQFIPQLSIFIVYVLIFISLIAFIYLINHVAQMIRPEKFSRRICMEGHKVLAEVYPEIYKAPGKPTSPIDENYNQKPTHKLINQGPSGVVLAVDIQGLIAFAKKARAIVSVVPSIGDFVSPGMAFFYIYGGGKKLDPGPLSHCIAIGDSRDYQQDPLFALRILVDICLRALSPGINDPTTAVTTIDQIYEFLVDASMRHLDVGKYRDESGNLLLLVRFPKWQDFVNLAVVEIRHFGRNSVQVLRRLCAMIQDLIDQVPEQRRLPLKRELALLKSMVKQSFAEPEDIKFAEVGDSQGIGAVRRSGVHRKSLSPSDIWHAPVDKKPGGNIIPK